MEIGDAAAHTYGMGHSPQSEHAQRRSRDRGGRFSTELLPEQDITLSSDAYQPVVPAWQVLAEQSTGHVPGAAPGEPGSGEPRLTPTTREFARDAYLVTYGGVDIGRVTRIDGRHKWVTTLIDTAGEISDWGPDHRDLDSAVSGLMATLSARVRQHRYGD